MGFDFVTGQAYYQTVRMVILAHMERSPDNFSPFVGDENDYRVYLAEMQRDRSWGDELTIRAAADAFGVRIHVITTEKENFLLHYEPERQKSDRILFLSYISPVHYNSVAPLR